MSECYKPTSGCGVYENRSCSECPYSKPNKERTDTMSNDPKFTYVDKSKLKNPNPNFIPPSSVPKTKTKEDIIKEIKRMKHEYEDITICDGDDYFYLSGYIDALKWVLSKK